MLQYFYVSLGPGRELEFVLRFKVSQQILLAASLLVAVDVAHGHGGHVKY